MPDDWSLTKFGKREYDESIEKVRHADRLIKLTYSSKACPTCSG